MHDRTDTRSGTGRRGRACAAALLALLALAGCSRRGHGPEEVARLKLADLHSVILAFHERNGRYPADADELRSALDDTGWGASVLLDPWGRGFLYHAPGRQHPGSFDLCSRGPDGQAGTADDICVLNPGPRHAEPLLFGPPGARGALTRPRARGHLASGCFFFTRRRT